MAFLKDDQFRYLLVNKANQSFFDRSESEIIGKTDFDLMPDTLASSCRQSDLTAMREKRLVTTFEKFEDQTFETRKFPVNLENGKIGIGGFIRDITSQLEIESRLRLQGLALNSVANAIMITDIKGKILSVNPAFTELTGYSAEEATGKHTRDLIRSGIHTKEFYEDLWKTILAGKVWKGEMINRRKDGTLYHEENIISPFQNPNGQITQFVSIKQDITERKQAELALEASEGKYRRLVDNAIIGIYTATLEGKFVDVNDSMCQILECRNPELLMNIHIQEIYRNPEERKNLVDLILKNGRILNYEVDLVTLKGNIRNVFVNAILEGNNILGMVLDMTDRKRNETELKQKKEKAEESDKLKSSFLANMSHEVRTPMNAIMGYAELLTSPNYSDKEKQDYISIISKSSEQLLRIMNDIVEISRIATGQITVNPSSFELNALLDDIYREFNPLAFLKNIKFTVNAGLTGASSRIVLDDIKLRLILSNLVDNAIKFTEKGSVELMYGLKDYALEFRVKDTGIGISKEHHEIIFERFRQLEDSYTRKYGGSGLGLSIAKSYAELLGGNIWVESSHGTGSTFVFQIPYVAAELSEINLGNLNQQAETATLSTILVAEDDDINFVYMERLLSKSDTAVIRAANGQEAVDICNSGIAVDLILMDINMPFMNGLDATRLIKEKRPELPIVAVTAYSLSGDRETCLAAGCNDYIPKPIRRDELLGKLQQFLKK